jgi:hypothetical protein
VAESAETPKELYSKCEARERELNNEAAWAGVKLGFIQALAFRPLFETEPSPRGTPLEANLARLHQAGRQSARYRDLLQLLKNCSNNEARLFVLACWLKQEGVCEPTDFLTPQVFQQLTAEARRRANVMSPTDWRYTAVVNAWKPYFERLITDFRTIKKTGIRRVNEKLVQDGYHEQAVTIATQKRRAVVPAVCQWLGQRGVGDARTLRNAYSRTSKFATSQQP